MAQPDSLNIVHVPRRYAPTHWGGTESVVEALCLNLSRLGHRQQVFTSRALDVRPRSLDRGVAVRRFGHFYPYWGLSSAQVQQLDLRAGNLFSFSLLRALWREPGLHLLHGHTGKRMGGIVRWVARRRQLPYVVSLHGGALDVPAAEAARWVEPTRGHWEWGRLLGAWVGSRRVLQDADLILCLGKEEQQRLQRQYPRCRIERFPNGVDLAAFTRAADPASNWRQRLGLQAQQRLLLCVGRIDPQKNQEMALQLLARLGPEHHLLLLGACTDPAYEALLRQRISQLGLGSRVHGLRPAQGDELLAAYQSADALLLPSLHEPFGIVVLEAWAAGLPVVASRVGGLVDLVECGRTGLLFPPGEVEAAQARVEQLLSQPELALRLRQQARQECELHYDWRALAERMVKLYREIVDAHSRR